MPYFCLVDCLFMFHCLKDLKFLLISPALIKFMPQVKRAGRRLGLPSSDFGLY